MVFKDQAIWKETDWSVILHRYHIKTLAKEGKSKILSRCYSRVIKVQETPIDYPTYFEISIEPFPEDDSVRVIFEN